MKAVLAALLCGALFGIGLALARMTDPLVVIGFLDVFGDFDPTLLVVLTGATVTTAVAFHFVLRRARPIMAAAFELPPTRTIDLPLVLGAAMFGVGWGLAGYCPGPALVGAGAGVSTALLFLPAMIVGGIVHRLVAARFTRLNALTRPSSLVTDVRR
jgi:uncharacterized membrane protein YedE/YeeE